jgi:hypothetical protein
MLGETDMALLAKWAKILGKKPMILEVEAVITYLVT